MKNILNIITHDAKRLTSSVVAIITIMGLCIIPCLYAWFNIFSNWAPYESEATGRIKVAVASDDKGSQILGLSVNVGEKIIDGLKANHDIGWVFTDDSAAAVEGVRAGDYYAALVIPEEFSNDVMSFATGELKHPQLIYYENEKKNAIAPKITGKAEEAVRAEVDSAFVETLAAYVSDAASVVEASGYDPQKVFSDLSGKMDDLNAKLDDCIVILDAAKGLADSADSLIRVSDQLLSDAQVTVGNSGEVLDAVSGSIPEEPEIGDTELDTIKKEKKQIEQDINKIKEDTEKAEKKREAYNRYIDRRLASHKKIIGKMIDTSKDNEKLLREIGLNALADRVMERRNKLESALGRMDRLDKASKEDWEQRRSDIRDLNSDLEEVISINEQIAAEGSQEVRTDLRTSIENIRQAMSDIQLTLEDMNGGLGGLSGILDSYSKSLGELQGSLGSTGTSIRYMQNGLSTLAALFDRIAGNRTLEEVGDVLANDKGAVAEYLASPVRMRTEVIYPIREYGSAMAPFYTVLAQWVGALLTAVLIKTRIRKREDLPDLNTAEHFFGRYGLYLFIGLAQALIVSLGDLLYVGIQCEHPLLFVLQACMNGITFMMINYALVFALENIGLAAGVIILVLQVAGSGGTYPAEVLPQIFRTLYPFMPFRYSMDAMRECIAGTYDHTYLKCMGILCIFFAVSAALGMLLMKPFRLINRMIEEAKQKSEIML